MAKAGERRLRCAIYTRKSTEEGLDQEFNSLDAQREACAAYILSQRHEGWLFHPEHYDDGGFTGGNMDRPGLKRLLADVESGRIDVIVVYKVDRLTRALSDFAKIVDVLDKAGASFVSITQAFNTTTSMGRLTLNVLLSFAQFEREVIAERVRDKIAASKAKGMWMGGPVPLGYEVIDRKLRPNEREAETVRYIMRRYLTLGSARAVIDDLRSSGVRTKVQRRSDGSLRGGGPFTRGALYHLLKNRIYRGEIVHKGQFYPGEHPAVVDAELFDAVQRQLVDQSIAGPASRDSHRSLLAGLIRDAQGRAMTPSHATKSGRRYRYYVSLPGPDGAAPSAMRLPALALERATVDGLIDVLSKPDILPAAADASQLSRLRPALSALRDGIATEAANATLASLGLRLIVARDRITATIDQRALMVTLVADDEWSHLSDQIDVPITTSSRRRGHELKLRIEAASGSPQRDDKLVAAIARGHTARRALLSSTELSAGALREMRRAARLSYLAPDITTAILDGRQPRSLTTRTLTRIANLPIRWVDQRRLLGFA